MTPARRAGGGHLVRLGDGQGEGFSQRTCLPASGGGDGPLLVEVSRAGDVDRLDFGVGEEGFVGVVGFGDAVLIGGLASDAGAFAGDGVEDRVLAGSDSGEESSSDDPSASEAAKSNRHVDLR